MGCSFDGFCDEEGHSKVVVMDEAEILVGGVRITWWCGEDEAEADDAA